MATDVNPVPPPPKDDSLPTRASLLARLQDWDDRDSWRDFSRTYERLVLGVGRKSGLTEAEAQDVLQEVLLSVAKTIGEFQSSARRGSFRAWLLNLTRWRIADQIRRRQALPPGQSGADVSDRTATVERVADPAGDSFEKAWDDEWQVRLMEAAVDRLRRRVKPRHFQIFELYTLRHWKPEAVARELGVSRIQVYLVQHRLLKQLKAEIEQLQRHWESQG